MKAKELKGRKAKNQVCLLTEQSSEASEECVVVVGHQVTKGGVEYLVKGTQESDSAGMWIPRENVDRTLVAAYTRGRSASRCST